MASLTHARGNVVDLFAGRIFPATIAIENGRIAAITPDSGPEPSTFLLPGFVDAHVHVESSMLPPAEVARLVLPHGTVAMVADPHEIANVLGEEGISFMLASAAQSPLRFSFGAPSCVPATSFETAGASLDADRVAHLLDDPQIHFLSEVMNWPGLLAGDPEVMAKIRAARERNKRVDGHAPLLRGEQARRYAAAGIETDHECQSLEEAEEKIALGMKIALREGSAAKNLDALLPLIDRHPDACFFCTDDCHPDDLITGHIDTLVRRALARGHDLFKVLSAASKNPVLHYGLDVGLLRVGDRADFIEADNLSTLRILRTVVGGEIVAQDGRSMLAHLPSATPNRFAATPISAEDLQIRATGRNARVIVAFDRQLITDEIAVEAPVQNGFLASDPPRDLLKLAVVSRYGPARPQVALIRGFGLQQGAIASSVAHDSHNIVACGATDDDLARAINTVIRCRGGLSLALGDRVELLPLPIAGLMSDAEGPAVAAEYAKLTAAARELGSPLGAPFMTLAFMALLVIPALKLSDRGLFSGTDFRFVPLFFD